MPIITRNPISMGTVSGTWTSTPTQTAANRYLSVNDFPDDVDSYIQCTALSGVLASIRFNTSNFSIPSNATNIVLRQLYYDSVASAGTATLVSRLLLSGTFYNHPDGFHNPSTTVTQRTETWSTNPATSAAWTPTAANNVTTIGFQTNDTTPNIRLYSCQWEVEYTLNARSYGFIIG